MTIAAPVRINGTDGHVAAVVKVGGKSRYYVHRILMPDGSEFQFHEKTEPTGAGVPTNNGNQGSAIGSAIDNSIPETEQNGNKNAPKKQLSLSDSEYDYQYGRPKVRGGWTVEKIQRQLKQERSHRGVVNELFKFNNLDEALNNIYYHGSTSSHNVLKAGSTINAKYSCIVYPYNPIIHLQREGIQRLRGTTENETNGNLHASPKAEGKPYGRGRSR